MIMYVRVRACTFVRVCMRTCVRACVRACACVDVCVRVCVRVRMGMYLCDCAIARESERECESVCSRVRK